MSNISKGVIVANVPEPPAPELKFYYNYFVPDERVNENGYDFEPLAGTAQKNYAAQDNSGFQDLINTNTNQTPEALHVAKTIPRFVHIRYKLSPEQNNQLAAPNAAGLQNGPLVVPLFVHHNDYLGNPFVVSDEMIASALSEGEYNTQSFGAMNLQDAAIGSRIKSLLDLTLQLRSSPTTQTQKGSVTDYAKALDALTPDSVHGSNILDAISAMIGEDVKLRSQLNFVNETKEPIGRDFLSAQASEKLSFSLNDKFFFTVLSSGVSQPFGPYSSSFAKLVFNEHQDLNENRLKENNFVDTHLDFKPTRVYMQLEKVPESAQENPDMLFSALPYGLVGYIAQKRELLPSGESLAVEDVIINLTSGGGFSHSVSNAIASEADGLDYFDTKVKYGAIYSYSLCAVYAFTGFEHIQDDPNYADGLYRGLYFIKSHPSAEKRITCDEYVAPDPPNDITFDYEFEKDGLLVSWELPTNPQRDTAKIQVLRRKSIFDPFTCVAEYDFNASVDSFGNPLPLPSFEYVIPRNKFSVAQNINGQKLVPSLHVDRGFNRNSDFIYAACAVDAHGYTSGYSDQFRVRFNKNINNIEVYRVSRTGAPKQYPNFYIESGYTQQKSLNNPLVSTPFENSSMPDASPADAISVTEEAMRDSGHKKMRVYFDPEFLSLKPSIIDGVETHPPHLLLPKNQNGSYGINIINLDRMKSKTIHFEIKDSIDIINNKQKTQPVNLEGVPGTALNTTNDEDQLDAIAELKEYGKVPLFFD